MVFIITALRILLVKLVLLLMALRAAQCGSQTNYIILVLEITCELPCYVCLDVPILPGKIDTLYDLLPKVFFGQLFCISTRRVHSANLQKNSLYKLFCFLLAMSTHIYFLFTFFFIVKCGGRVCSILIQTSFMLVASILNTWIY